MADKTEVSKDKKILTPLTRARGLGSAGSGSGHWMAQRLTALSNLFLLIWLLYSLLILPLPDYGAISLWIKQPHNTILLTLCVCSLFRHAFLGVEVIIEDYVHHTGAKLCGLIAAKFMFFALVAVCLVSILAAAFSSV